MVDGDGDDDDSMRYWLGEDTYWLTVTYIHMISHCVHSARHIPIFTVKPQYHTYFLVVLEEKEA